MESFEASGYSSLATIHGFRVESYGKRISSGFQRGLRRLAERSFDDESCVVVKTANGKRSGITHAGGRYIHPANAHGREVMRQMRELGMEPPAPPFLLAPGEVTLYHEWGHHVDRTWSVGNEEVFFSLHWLSRFYSLRVGIPRIAHAEHDFTVEYDEFQPIESDAQACNAVVAWWRASSELFADLIEDWMRGEKKASWDHCEPASLNSPHRRDPGVRISLLPGVQPEDVRAETYALFSAGLRPVPHLPSPRPGLLGPNTSEIVAKLRDVLKHASAEGCPDYRLQFKHPVG